MNSITQIENVKTSAVENISFLKDCESTLPSWLKGSVNKSIELMNRRCELEEKIKMCNAKKQEFNQVLVRDIKGECDAILLKEKIKTKSTKRCSAFDI